MKLPHPLLPEHFVDSCDIQIRSDVPQDDAPLREIREAVEAGLEVISEKLPAGFVLDVSARGHPYNEDAHDLY